MTHAISQRKGGHADPKQEHCQGERGRERGGRGQAWGSLLFARTFFNKTTKEQHLRGVWIILTKGAEWGFTYWELKQAVCFRSLQMRRGELGGRAGSIECGDIWRWHLIKVIRSWEAKPTGYPSGSIPSSYQNPPSSKQLNFPILERRSVLDSCLQTSF